MEEERTLRVAREKLGQEAMLEQLALECHIQHHASHPKDPAAD
jgi:hypothetical protein